MEDTQNKNTETNHFDHFQNGTSCFSMHEVNIFLHALLLSYMSGAHFTKALKSEV